MSIFGGIGRALGAAGGFLIGGPAGAAAGYSIGGGIGGAVDANQTKQQNKGTIAQAYRQNVAQQNLQQANVRQNTNESLNARGVLSNGAVQNPTGITTQSVPVGVHAWGIPNKTVNTGGTIAEQVARSGGGSGIDPYLAQGGVGAVGPTNTLSGGANRQLTDQFGLEDKSLADAKTQALNQNTANYDNSLVSGIGQAVGGGLNLYAGLTAGGGSSGSAIPDSAFKVNSVNPTSYPSEQNQTAMMGNFGPVNPSFQKTPSGTQIGSGGTPNYSFNVG